MSLFLFLLLGLFVGTFGTLIGAGGGIILVPSLLLLFPKFTSTQITAISLFAVACNATSGSISYLARKKVDLKSAMLFSTASIPGALGGSYLSHFVNRQYFSFIFAGLMFTLGSYLVIKQKKSTALIEETSFQLNNKQLIIGWLISLAIGFIASFLGIGGGIIHVPLMTEVLAYPVHIATGTSHFILAFTAIVASIQHYLNGDLQLTHSFIWPIAIGVIIGAQIGAALSKKVKGTAIKKILGITLILVALRLILIHFWR